jgi:hypothetical protein
MLTDPFRSHRRLFRKAVQQGRSKRRGEAYSLQYVVEPLSAARTPLVDFVNSLLDQYGRLSKRGKASSGGRLSLMPGLDVTSYHSVSAQSLL